MSNQATPIEFFREISPYILKHRENTFVIAFAGEVIEQQNFHRLIQDIAIIASLGVKTVLVHGTRPQIEARLSRGNHSAQFHNNIRITDQEALAAAQESCGYLRIKIEHLLTAALNQPMTNSKSLSVITGNFISAKPLGVIGGIDYKSTGQVRRIHAQQIEQQLERDSVVLLSPIGYSPTGESYNLNYEETALATASALKAHKLIFISNEYQELPSSLTAEEAGKLGEMNPLLAKIANTVGKNIERIHLINSQADGALLLELYTRNGMGCMIATEHLERTRSAKLEDITGVLDLIRPLEEMGILVKRSREQLELEIPKFQVVEVEQLIVGCAALYDTAEPDLSEMACFTIHNQYRAAHRGQHLLEHMEALAKQQGKKRLLVLTTQTSDWFKERGFVERSIDDLPENKKRLYNYKRNSRVLIKPLV